MAGNSKYLAAAGAVIVIGAAIFYFVRQQPATPSAPAPTPVTQAVPAPATAPAATPAPAAVDACLLPGPIPVVPSGNTASPSDMEENHDAIQAFVVQLEAFQNCREDQIVKAPASVSADQKQQWRDQGNAAVDEANALAAAFSEQLKLFKANHPGQ